MLAYCRRAPESRNRVWPSAAQLLKGFHYHLLETRRLVRTPPEPRHGWLGFRQKRAMTSSPPNETSQHGARPNN